MIGVIATIQTAEGRREEMYAAYRRLVPLILANEPGCIEYIPLIDRQTGLTNQQPVRADTIVVMERWKDLETFYAHLNAPHSAAFRKETEAIRHGVTLQVMKPIF